MGDFKVNMNKMEEIVTKLKTIQADMDNSYDKMSMLMTTIETEKEWNGQAQKEFLAFMRLMQMYHKEFTSELEGNCVEGAIKTISSFIEKVTTFEQDNVEFGKMKGISY